MNHRVILFDLDGTLIDSLADIAAAANAALRRLNQPAHPEAAYRLMVGDGADVLLRRALPADQQHLADEALALFRQHYGRHLADQTTLYDGIADLLHALAARGVPMAIVTNKPQRAAEQIVAHLLHQWQWVSMDGHREGMAKKPDPTAALAVARVAGVAPEQCLFVGDSKTDMATAEAAGMCGVGVTWGFRHRDELLAHGARHLIDQPHQLLDLLTLQHS